MNCYKSKLKQTEVTPYGLSSGSFAGTGKHPMDFLNSLTNFVVKTIYSKLEHSPLNWSFDVLYKHTIAKSLRCYMHK